MSMPTEDIRMDHGDDAIHNPTNNLNTNGGYSDLFDSDVEESPPPSPAGRSSAYSARPDTAASLEDAMKRMLLNPDYADCTIEVVSGFETVRFPAHQSVICSQCSFFANALKDNPTKTISITDETPKNIYRLLSYLYTSEYCSSPESYEGAKRMIDPRFPTLSEQYSTRANFLMYLCAQKFNLPRLAKKAVVNHFEIIQQYFEPEDAIWAAGIACTMFKEHRYDAMKMVHVAKLMQEIWENGGTELFVDGSLKKLCEKYGEFGFDLFEAYHWERENRVDTGEPELTSRPYRWVAREDGGWDIMFGWEEGEGWIAKTISED